MKKALIIIAIVILAAGLLAVIGYFYWGWFGGAESDTSEYDECVAANKAKADGEPCTSCVPERAAGPNFKGQIKNGECINVAETPKYIVTNPEGATIYGFPDGNYIDTNAAKVPLNTEVTITAISANQKFARTSYGWILVQDISVL